MVNALVAPNKAGLLPAGRHWSLLSAYFNGIGSAATAASALVNLFAIVVVCAFPDLRLGTFALQLPDQVALAVASVSFCTNAMVLFMAMGESAILRDWSTFLQPLRSPLQVLQVQSLQAAVVGLAWSTLQLMPWYRVVDVRVVMLRMTHHAIVYLHSTQLTPITRQSSKSVASLVVLRTLSGVVGPVLLIIAELIWERQPDTLHALNWAIGGLVFFVAAAAAALRLAHPCTELGRRARQYLGHQSKQGVAAFRSRGHTYLMLYFGIGVVCAAAMLTPVMTGVLAQAAPELSSHPRMIAVITALASCVSEVLQLVVTPRFASKTLMLDTIQRSTAAERQAAAVQRDTLRWVSHEARVPAQILVLSLEEVGDSVRELLQMTRRSAPCSASLLDATHSQITAARATCSQLVAVLTSSLEYARLTAAEESKEVAGNAALQEHLHLSDTSVLHMVLNTCICTAPAFRAVEANLLLDLSWSIGDEQGRRQYLFKQQSWGPRTESFNMLGNTLPSSGDMMIPGAELDAALEVSKRRLKQNASSSLSSRAQQPSGPAPSRPGHSPRAGAAAPADVMRCWSSAELEGTFPSTRTMPSSTHASMASLSAARSQHEATEFNLDGLSQAAGGAQGLRRSEALQATNFALASAEQEVACISAHVNVLRVQQLLHNLLSNALKYGLSDAATVTHDGTQASRMVEVKARMQTSQPCHTRGGRIPCELVISVQDHGRGMSEHDVLQLFQAFSQLRSADRQRGSGLGLQISATWLQQQGGTLKARSDGIGLGSTFEMVLPLQGELLHGAPASMLVDQTLGVVGRGQSRHQTLHFVRGSDTDHSSILSGASLAVPVSTTDDHDEGLLAAPGSAGQSGEHVAVAPAPHVTPATVAPPSSSPFVTSTDEGATARSLPLQLLLVDDSVATRKVVRKALSRTKHAVQFAEADNGSIALGLALRARDAGTPFDIIFTDASMPVMDGYESVAAMRSQGISQRIVGLTGNAAANDVQKFVDAGADVVLTKPVSSALLLAELDRVANKAAGSSPARPAHNTASEPALPVVSPPPTGHSS